jgi:hypothetical protein
MPRAAGPAWLAGTAQPSNRLLARRRALSRWENEGGAVCKPQGTSDDQLSDVPMLSHAELSRLRARVVALENVLIALLAGASIDQQNLVREMAGYLSAAEVQSGPEDHRTADEMLSLLDRSGQFRSD